MNKMVIIINGKDYNDDDGDGEDDMMMMVKSDCDKYRWK